MLRRRKLKAAVIILVIYIASYVILSVLGEYRPDMTGKRRYSFGLALVDVDHWRPKGVYFRKYRSVTGENKVDANPLGMVYAPLILLDRWLVHPSHEIPDQ